ncbi:MAG: hypothetical protein AAGJ93_05785 [Bacteroidota bacterium]
MSEKKPVHRNSHQNQEPHHLYEFFDQQENEVFKYGISSDPIEEDGLSRRMRRQQDIFNLAAGWFRYLVKILIKNIPGRKAAEILEDEHLDAFEKENSRLPRGNRRKNRSA